MRANSTATNINNDGGEAALAASQQCDAPLNAACARACDLIRDYFTRGSPLIADDQRSIDETILAELWDEVKAAVGCVARLPALSFEDVGFKRGVQHALRPHREMCDDLLAIVGKSVDKDMQTQLARVERGSITGHSGWFGWTLPLWRPRAESTSGERTFLDA